MYWLVSPGWLTLCLRRIGSAAPTYLVGSMIGRCPENPPASMPGKKAEPTALVNAARSSSAGVTAPGWGGPFQSCWNVPWFQSSMTPYWIFVSVAASLASKGISPVPPPFGFASALKIAFRAAVA